MKWIDKKYTIESLETSSLKSFTPVRILLQKDEWMNKLLSNDGNQEDDAFIESLFGINQVFSQGPTGWLMHEFGYTFAALDTIQLYLSLLVESTDKSYEHIINVFEEARMAMQNFLFFLMNASYYSALLEMRIVAESCLWINKLLDEGQINFTSLVDYGSIGSQFLDSQKNIKKFWKYSSNIMHNRKIVIYNWENESKDDTHDLLVLLQKCTSDIESTYNRLFNDKRLLENEVLFKFNKLYIKYKSILKQSEYDLTDRPVKQTASLSLEKAFDKYMTYVNNPSRFNLLRAKSDYRQDLATRVKYIHAEFQDKIRRDKDPIQLLALRNYLMRSKDFINYDEEQLIWEIINGSTYQKRLLDWIMYKTNSDQYRRAFKRELNDLYDVLSDLFVDEIKNQDSSLTLLRLISEDVALNIPLGKPYAYNLLSLISFVTNIHIDKKYKDPGNRHFRNINRVKYINQNSMKETGVIISSKEILNEIIMILKEYKK